MSLSRPFRFMALAAPVFALAACVTPADHPPAQAPAKSTMNAAMIEAVRGSPQLRRAATAECVRDTARDPLAARRNIAMIINTSVAKAPQVFCERLMMGLASGKLTVADVDSVDRGEITPNTIRVLQGR